MYTLTGEAFDAVKCVLAAAGIRLLIKSPLKAITLRDAILFVLIAVVLVPFGTAFWGASFTVSYGFGTHYWIEWRNLGISNAVTAVVLVPAFLLGAHHCSSGAREPFLPDACWKRLSSVRVRWRWETSYSTEHPRVPILRRAPVHADSSAHLGGAPLRPWWHQRLDVGRHVPGDLGNHARARAVPDPDPRRECGGTAAVPPGDRHSADAARGGDRRGKTLERSVASEREPDGSRRGRRQPGHVGVGCVRQRCVDDRAGALAVWPRAGRPPRFCGNLRSRAPRGSRRP